jgi:Zn-dependent protease
MISFQTKSTNLTFNFSFFALIAVMILLREKNIVFLNLAGCLLHEIGHFIACKICKVRIKKFSFSCTGFCIKKLETKNLTYNNEIFILSSGIIVNLFISLFAFLSQNTEYKLFGIINLTIAVFNFLPLNGFDGFQIRELLLARNVPLSNIGSYNKLLNIVDILLFVILIFAILMVGNRDFGIYLIPITFIIIRKFED